MELTLIILVSIVMLTLIWTLWQLNRLQQQLNVYNDYVGEVRREIVEDVISEEFLGQLRNHAQLELTNTVQGMDDQLKQALTQSYQQLLQSIEQEAAQIINGELEQYRQTITEARTAAANVTSETEKQLSDIRSTIESEAQTAIREEKQQLLQQLDSKMSDIIVHYLLQALGENVDLGSQKEYILAELEAHKEEIKRDINDEY